MTGPGLSLVPASFEEGGNLVPQVVQEVFVLLLLLLWLLGDVFVNK